MSLSNVMYDLISVWGVGSSQMDNVHVRLQGDQLLSDMSAFKAANPGCVFDDFIRWYSPSDWAPDEQQRRGQLSKRMAVPGNTWQTCWELAQPRAASEQKALFEPSQEGERALHFLETLQPDKLFEELHTLGIAAVVGLLAESAGSSLPEARRTISETMQQVGAVLQQQVPPQIAVYLLTVQSCCATFPLIHHSVGIV